MQIKSINNTNFGLIRGTKTIYHPNKKIISDTIYLQNGNSVKINKTYDKYNNLIEKFTCLHDNFGDWIKLKVDTIKNGKIINTFKGEK